LKKKVALINYFNSIPFLEGMVGSDAFASTFEVQTAVPAECARLFKEQQVDVAIVPVGALNSIGNYHLLSDYCIGAIDHVKTVAVFANDSLEKLSTIYLDTESRSSVKLLKVLLAEFWKVSPLLKDMHSFNGELQQNEGLLCIGDKTFPMLSQFAFQYDLATAWNQYTGLPFVFAVWVQNGTLSNSEQKIFNQTLSEGIAHRAEYAVKMHALYPEIDFQDYYFNCINYNLEAEKLKAIHLFLEKSKNYD
jgi:chorismate dehydratase